MQTFWLTDRLLIVAGDGIIAIPKKLTSNLPPSLPSDTDPEYNVYGVSMFHQLHCLVSYHMLLRLFHLARFRAKSSH